MTKKEELDRFIAYRDKLSQSRLQKSKEAFFNDSAIHEEFVLKELFANAVDSTPAISTIYMYCGKMTAFREEIRELVDKKKEELRPENDAPEEERKKWEDFNPYAKMIASMESFFQKEGRLEVIVDDSNIQSITEESIWRDTLCLYYNEKKLTIHQLREKNGLEHFVVCGNAYRSELSHDDKTALCCFNDEGYASLLYSNFNFMKQSSVPISI